LRSENRDGFLTQPLALLSEMRACEAEFKNWKKYLIACTQVAGNVLAF